MRSTPTVSLGEPFEITDNRIQTLYLQSSCFPQAAPEGHDVVEGLEQCPKVLPPKYFYDDRGSQLFEQICELPEYYPTRTEAWILHHYAPEIAQLTGSCELIELGSGSSTKTRLLLNAYQSYGYPLSYQPIDVSAGMLRESATQLLIDYPTLKVKAVVGTYEQALISLPRATISPRMLLFLGSTLGNLTPLQCDQFFTQVATALDAGDYVLLGIDLQKDRAILEAAYNDSQGVTADFNLNMLRHLNYRYGGNFNLEFFHHQALYNPVDCQIEMYLHCHQAQSVELKTINLNITLAQGEGIRTEISRKFNLQQMQQYLQTHGLSPLQIWTDPKQWFGVILCRR